jgi:hypothetical protein
MAIYLLIIQNLHLHSPGPRIRRRPKRLHAFLQPVPMRNQRLKVNHPRRNETDSLRIGVMIPVLELKIYLPRRQVHEGHVLEVSPHADYEDGAAEAG